MILVGGVDEAGLGPLLGPLCIGAAGVLVPDDAGDDQLWDRLERAVTRDLKRDKERIVVDDSKRVFTRNERGRRRLETTVCAFASATGRPLARVEDLALWPDDEAAARADHPWRDDPAPAPHHVSEDFVELRADLLARALEAADARVALFGTRTVEPGELNPAMDAAGSKSGAVWTWAAAGLAALLDAAVDAGATRADLTLDRQGGRAKYGAALARALPGYTVHLVGESNEVSRYRLTGPIEARITCATKADATSFTTALASCGAKYAREASMDALNRWFAARVEGLAPTAGYTTDGRRFLADLAQRAPGLLDELDRDLLVRRR